MTKFRSQKAKRGAVVAETLVLLPLAVILILGTFELGIIVMDSHVLRYASYEVAHVSALNAKKIGRKNTTGFDWLDSFLGWVSGTTRPYLMGFMHTSTGGLSHILGARGVDALWEGGGDWLNQGTVRYELPDSDKLEEYAEQIVSLRPPADPDAPDQPPEEGFHSRVRGVSISSIKLLFVAPDGQSGLYQFPKGTAPSGSLQNTSLPVADGLLVKMSVKRHLSILPWIFSMAHEEGDDQGGGGEPVSDAMWLSAKGLAPLYIPSRWED